MNDAVTVSMVEDTQKKSIGKTARYYIYLTIKRIFDILIALIGLFFLLPVALIVKLSYMFTGDFKSIFFSPVDKPFDFCLKLRFLTTSATS